MEEKERLPPGRSDDLAGIPYQDFSSSDSIQVSVYCVGERFLIFEESDVIELRGELRMIAEPLAMPATPTIGTFDDGAPIYPPPYAIMPEQAAALAEYGFAKFYRRKPYVACEPYDETLFEPSTSAEKKIDDFFEDDVSKARQIAIGRKAKELKRKLNGANANARVLKIRKKDLDSVVVTDEEVVAVLEEITQKKDETGDSETGLVNLALYDPNPALYDELTFYDLPLSDSRESRARRKVFHDLWRRGFYLTDGLKFGCHFLAYEGHPGTTHAKYLVECHDNDAVLTPAHFTTLSRLASQVAKTVLLASVSDDTSVPQYSHFGWWRPY